MSHTRPPEPLRRSDDNRVLAGVCAGIARARAIPVSAVRTAFVLTTAVFGMGALAYLACCLILPAEGQQAPGGRRAIVVIAQACAACAGLVTVGALAGAATIFGLGGVVVGACGVLLCASLIAWPRLQPGWALLPVAAAVLPSVAVSAGGVRVPAQAGDRVWRPASVADFPPHGYRSGLGHMLIDLRHTGLPSDDDGTLHLVTGIKRTIVALPSDRCIRLRVRFEITPFAAELASALLGSGDRPFSNVVVFGTVSSGRRGTAAGASGSGPTLTIDFRSSGGSLYVRDFPDDVDPRLNPNWPGVPVAPEPRPETTGLSRRTRAELLGAWRVRHGDEVRDAARVRRLMSGPCAKTARRPTR